MSKRFGGLGKDFANSFDFFGLPRRFAPRNDEGFGMTKEAEDDKKKLKNTRKKIFFPKKAIFAPRLFL